MLYKAIKLQAEKGPVDAVTGDARYSLSEDTLLREKIEPRVIIINVESGGEVVQCRIPDCDTITQTKEKILDHIYKNIPFSQRPNVRDLDLGTAFIINKYLVLMFYILILIIQSHDCNTINLADYLIVVFVYIYVRFQ